MFYLREMCCLCLSTTNVSFYDLNSKSKDNLTNFEKISLSLSSLTSLIETNSEYKLCERCHNTINMIYDFNQVCSRNLNKLTSYRRLLKQKCDKKPFSLNVSLKRIQNVESGKTIYLNTDSKVYADSKDHSVINSDSNNLIGVRIKEEPGDFTVFDDENEGDNLDELEVKVEFEEYYIKEECFDGQNEKFEENQLKNPDLEERSVSDKNVSNSIEERISANVKTSDVLPGASTGIQQEDLLSTNENIIQKTLEDKRNKMYECDVCNKLYLREYNLEYHKRFHNGDKPFKCNICQKLFFRKGHLNQHMNSIHNSMNLFECEICKKWFPKQSSLNIHKLIHNKVKGNTYSCNLCQKTFSKKTFLLKHYMIHSDKKVFKCDLCTKQFTTTDSLRSHKLIHNRESLIRYECDICHKTYAPKSSFLIHKRVHTGEKPYHCDVCNAGFTQSSNLKKHKKSLKH